MLKKFFILVFIIILTLLCFKKDKDDNTLVFWTLQLSNYDKYISNIINEYEKMHPEVKIKWIDIPYSEGEKRTLAAILSDNSPDLVNLTPDFSLLLAQKQALFTFDENELKDYVPSVVEMLKYDSKCFGIPFYATSAVTLYNTELVKTKKLPKTYDDLFKFVPQKNSFTTMINFAENDTFLKILNKYGINSAQTINSEKSVQLYTNFKTIYDRGFLPKESITQTHRDSLEKYMSGQLAFLTTGANFINMIKENAPSVYKTTKILPQITGDTLLYDYSLMNFIIPLRAKHKQEALDFALYFTNEINQLKLAQLTPILPVNKKTLEHEYFKSSSVDSLESQARIISTAQLNHLQPPIKNIKNKKELNTLSGNYIQEILINNAPISQTLNKFSKDWEKL